MIKSLILLLGILLGVAFLTLVERKILGYIHLRKGPNLVGISGLMQPFSDGLKIISKQTIISNFSNLKITGAPIFFFFLSLVIWSPLLMSGGILMTNSLLFFLFLSSFGALVIFVTGWGGGSTFSFLGGIRASAQMISYEVVLSFLLSLPMLYYFNLNFLVMKTNMLLSSWLSILISIPMILISILAETNRAPFDLTEGESELVSGFNTEFSSTLFVLLFLGEYAFILLFSVICSYILFNCSFFWWTITLYFLWVRACFPRKRYDLLMWLMWIILFPQACFFLMFNIIIVAF